MHNSIHMRSKLAKSIFDQWLMLNIPAAELYKCGKCYALELQYNKCNLGMCPEDLVGMNTNCDPNHKNGIQAYLAVDATPSRGGIVFFTCTGSQKCFYYQPEFNDLGIKINPLRSTEFEMVNLLIALCIFKNEILNHKTVRIIADNNNLRDKCKVQRSALTEAIAAILQWCDNSGCTINEIFPGSLPGDKPFLRVADKLSRKKNIRHWIRQLPHSQLDESWKFVLFGDYDEIPLERRCMNAHMLASINLILQESQRLNMDGPESSLDYSYTYTTRLQRMITMMLRSNKNVLPYITTRLIPPIDRSILEYVPTPSTESVGLWKTSVLVFTLIGLACFAFNNFSR